jgi:hypothetical protein
MGGAGTGGTTNVRVEAGSLTVVNTATLEAGGTGGAGGQNGAGGTGQGGNARIGVVAGGKIISAPPM